LAGADPWKLQQQIVKHGHSTLGMPAVWVEADPDGRLQIVDVVTRAARVAKMLPGTCVTRLRTSRTHLVGAAREFLDILENRQSKDDPALSSNLRDRMQSMMVAVADLPADFSTEHDHYIHGTPRRNVTLKAS